LLDQDPVPEPSPERWRRLKQDVLSEVGITSRKRSVPPSAAAAWWTRPARLAAGFALIAAGALGAQLLPWQRFDARELGELEQQAHRQLDLGDLGGARAAHSRIVEHGAPLPRAQGMVSAALAELTALRAYQALPRTSKQRQAALAQFIYRYPAARATFGAMAELRGGQTKRAGRPTSDSLERFDDFPKLSSDKAFVLRPFTNKGEFVQPGRPAEPWLQNAANVQLALLELDGGDEAAARSYLQRVEGPGPAARFAEETLERLASR
jgi:hypothetical protein